MEKQPEKEETSKGEIMTIRHEFFPIKRKEEKEDEA